MSGLARVVIENEEGDWERQGGKRGRVRGVLVGPVRSQSEARELLKSYGGRELDRGVRLWEWMSYQQEKETKYGQLYASKHACISVESVFLGYP